MMNYEFRYRLLPALLLLQIVPLTTSLVTVSVTLVSFANPEGFGADRKECDVRTKGCDHFFVFCVDRYNGDAVNFDVCAYGRTVTNVFQNSYILVFDQFNLTFPNPITLDVPDNETGILLKVKTLDEDKKPTPDDHVDVLSHKVTSGSPYTVGTDNTSAMPVGTEVVGQTNKRLTIRVSVYCARHYFLWQGSCLRYCTDQDDLFTKYTCNEEGERRCIQGTICHFNKTDAEAPKLNNPDTESDTTLLSLVIGFSVGLIVFGLILGILVALYVKSRRAQRISSGQMNECNRSKRTTDPGPPRPVSDRPYETLHIPDTLSATYYNQLVVPKDTTNEENYTDPSGYIVII